MENPTFYALIFAAFCIAVAISSLLLPRILMIALRKKLVSLPNSCRDIHVKPIPRLGGVAFFPNILFTVSFIIAVSILIGQPYPEIGLSAEFLLAICAVVVLYLTGVADDLVGVPYKYKFVAQILCSLSLPIAGLYVEGLDGFLFIGALPMWIGIPFAMLIIVFVVNTINLVDGIDGLASGISMVVLIALGCAFMRYGMWLYTLIAFTTVGTLIPFFYFNVFGGKKKGRNLFMGDTGSLTLGFIIAWLSLKYAFGTPESPASQISILFPVSLMTVPTLDALRVMMLRRKSGKKLFEPDRNHIHHIMIDGGYTPRRAMFTLVLITALYGIVNYLLLPHINGTLMFVINILVWTLLTIWWYKRKAAYQKKILSQAKA